MSSSFVETSQSGGVFFVVFTPIGAGVMLLLEDGNTA